MTRRRRAWSAVVPVAALVLATASPAPATPGQAEPGASIGLVDRPPWVAPEDEATFLVTTSGDLAGATVQVEVFSALDSVEELEDSATEDVGVRLSRSAPLGVGFLAAGPAGSQVVGVSVSAEPVDGSTVQIVEPGVHPVVISLLGPGGDVLDQIRTPLVRLGDDEQEWNAPDLAVLLDVAAAPSLQPDGTRSIEAGELRRIARVGDLLEAHPDLGLSVAALPDTVDALGTLAEPAAAELLAQLAERDPLSVPYLPVPVGSLVEAGLGGLVAPLVDRGDALLADRLGAEPARGPWTGTAELGPEGARLLAGLGFDSVVVEGTATGDDGEEDPDALVEAGPRPVEGAGLLAGMAVDPTLSEALAEGVGDDPDAAHVALARLLLSTVTPAPDEDDEEDEERPVVLVRPGQLAADSVLAGLLALLDDPAAPVGAGGLELVGTVVEDGSEPVEPTGAAGPDVGDIADRVLAIGGQLDSYQALIGPQSSRADDMRLQVATALATTTPAPRRDAAMDTVEEVLGSAFGSVRLSGERNLNLTSRRGTLPVTVENANPFPVDVVIRTTSDRLRFPDGGDLPVTVEAGDARRVDVPVEALATGSVPVSVALWTADGSIRLDGRQLNVRSTAISGVGLLLSLGALVVLVVWWIRSWRRTRRDAPRDPGPVEGSMG